MITNTHSNYLRIYGAIFLERQIFQLLDYQIHSTIHKALRIRREYDLAEKKKSTVGDLRIEIITEASIIDLYFVGDAKYLYVEHE